MWNIPIRHALHDYQYDQRHRAYKSQYGFSFSRNPASTYKKDTDSHDCNTVGNIHDTIALTSPKNYFII